MTIKFIAAAFATAAFVSGAVCNYQALAEDANFGEESMAKQGKRAINASVRNTRPATDRHKDARACLDKDKNEAIIRCAQKYR